MADESWAAPQRVPSHLIPQPVRRVNKMSLAANNQRYTTRVQPVDDYLAAAVTLSRFNSYSNTHLSRQQNGIWAANRWCDRLNYNSVVLISLAASRQTLWNLIQFWKNCLGRTRAGMPGAATRA